MPAKREEINKLDTGWKVSEYAEKYYGEVRGGIPLSAEHMEIMLRLIDGLKRPVKSFLDLGCGNGLASGVILLRHPRANGVLIDFNEAMLYAAKKQLSDYGENMFYCEEDLAKKTWLRCSLKYGPFDVVVSSFMIHHLTDKRKKEIFDEVFGLLSPGGLFVLIEQVSPASKWLGDLGVRLFHKSLLEFHSRKGEGKTSSQVWDLVRGTSSYWNQISPLDSQLKWLTETGYKDVDCYFKLFDGAVFGGRKPTKHGKV